MKFEVRKPFTWAGQNLVRGEVVEIPDESIKIGSLTRAKFIRYADQKAEVGKPPAPVLPTIDEVAEEMQAEELVPGPAVRGAKEIVRRAKARAEALAKG